MNAAASAPTAATDALSRFAATFGLNRDTLAAIGWANKTVNGAAAVRVPAYDRSGAETGALFLQGWSDERGVTQRRWASGSKPGLLGLECHAEAVAAGHVTLCFSELDFLALRAAGVPAFAMLMDWRAEYARAFDDIGTVFVLPVDSAIPEWLSKSGIKSTLQICWHPVGHVWELARDAGAAFPEEVKQWQANAEPYAKVQAEQQANETRRKAASLEASCASLRQSPDALTEFERDIADAGLIGEGRNAKLLLLASVSRALPQPISVFVGGPAAAGKNCLVEKVLSFVPEDAVHVLTGMSEHALLYDQAPIARKHIVLAEAPGLGDGFGAYAMRSLLSENRLRYTTVQKTENGLTAVTLEREGPTGLIVTSTRTSLEPELMTRMLKLTIEDTPSQTKRVMRQIAKKAAHGR